MERREFIRFLLASGALLPELGFFGCAVPKTQTTSAASKYRGKVLISSSKDESSSIVRIWDWDHGGSVEYTVPLSLPHSFLQDREQNFLTLFEAGGSCARVDLATRKVIKIDHRAKEGHFSGHGVRVAAGDRLLCTEIDMALGRQIVGIRSNSTLKRLGEAPKECDYSHQVISLPGTSLAACGNMSKPDKSYGGGITFFDYEKGKVANRVEFEHPILHVIALSKDEVVGLSYVTHPKKLAKKYGNPTERDSQRNIAAYIATVDITAGPLYVAKLDGTKRTLWDEKRKELFGHGFGLTGIPHTRNFLSGHRSSNSVILWKDFEIARTYPVPFPSNIVVSSDASEFLVLGGSGLKRFSLETNEELPAPEGFREVQALYPYWS